MLIGDDERRLWLTVIFRSMEEARGVPSFVGMSPIWTWQARRWLTADKFGQLKLTCHLAGLSTEQYKKLRENMRKLYGVVGATKEEK